MAEFKYTLSKPLRSQSLLQVLQRIERGKPIHATSAVAAVAAASLPTVESSDQPAAAARVTTKSSPAQLHPAQPSSSQSSPAPSNQDMPPVVSLASHSVSQATLYQLQTWPDLTRMLAVLRLDAARVCALLAVRPSSAEFIAQFLDLSISDVDQVLAEIRQCAHPAYATVTEQQSASTQQATHGGHGGHGGHSTAAESNASASLLSKLWNRLKGAA